MRWLYFIPVLAILLAGTQSFGQTPRSAPIAQSASKPESTIEFDRLVTIEGDVFLDVKILEIEPDSLLVEHRDGISRVSLFDLPDDIRSNYGFDRDRAIAHYKERDERLRSMRRVQFEERLRVENLKAEEARREAFDEDLRRNWIRCRARIIEFTNDGALAYVERITKEPSRTRTALGGEGLPGPLKLVYSPLSRKPVLLKGIAKTATGDVITTSWTGFVRRDPVDALNSGANREATKPAVYQAAVLSRSE